MHYGMRIVLPRWTVLAVLGCLAGVAEAQKLQVITDETTGVRVGIPVASVGAPTTKQWGRNWSSSRGELSIDTVNYGNQTLEAWYNTLLARTHRTYTKKEFANGRFLLEGIDRKGHPYHFHVQGYRTGDELRGLSIVYSTSASGKLKPVAQSVIDSFEPFPKPIIVKHEPSDTKKIEERDRQIRELIARVEDRERQVRDLIAKVRLLESQPGQSQRERELLAQLKEGLIEQDSLRKKRDVLQTELEKSISEVGRLQETITELEGIIRTLRGGTSSGRVALVIGNDHYPHLPATRQLERSVRDARAVARALKDIGFTVTLVENLSRQDMMERITTFTESINSGDTAVVYYSGHGVAIAGANYIVPSDVKPPQPNQQAVLRERTIAESHIVAELQRKAQVTVLVLDACRDNPFELAGTKSIGIAEKGLVRSTPAQGVFAIYSAGAGQAALDHLGPHDKSCNSVFTRVFVAQLYRTHGTHLGDIVIDLREEVRKEAAKVNHRQTPAYYDETHGGRIFLAPHPPKGPPTGYGPDGCN